MRNMLKRIAERALVLPVLALLLAAPMAFAQSYGTPPNPSFTPTVTASAPMTAAAVTAAPVDEVFLLNNIGALTVNVAGTISGLAAELDGSVDYVSSNPSAAHWSSALNFSPVPTGALASSITATGVYRANVAGFRAVRFHATALASGTATVAMAGTPARDVLSVLSDGVNVPKVQPASTAPVAADRSLTVAMSPNSADVCQNPNVAKSSAVINIGAAATTKIVDTSGTKTVYVCSFHLSLAGTTPTLVFKTGTHASADCDTSAASLSGTYAPVTGSLLGQGGSGVLMTSIAGGQVCGTTSGSGSSAQGILTYVQQ